MNDRPKSVQGIAPTHVQGIPISPSRQIGFTLIELLVVIAITSMRCLLRVCSLNAVRRGEALDES